MTSKGWFILFWPAVFIAELMSRTLFGQHLLIDDQKALVIIWIVILGLLIFKERHDYPEAEVEESDIADTPAVSYEPKEKPGIAAHVVVEYPGEQSLECWTTFIMELPSMGGYVVLNRGMYNNDCDIVGIVSMVCQSVFPCEDRVQWHMFVSIDSLDDYQKLVDGSGWYAIETEDEDNDVQSTEKSHSPPTPAV